MSIAGEKLMGGLNPEDVEELTGKIRADVITPDDPRYNEARKIYNAMIDRHPALIIRCADEADVMAAVKFGREHNMNIAVRGGGHSGPGFAMVDNGLVIDLSPMKGIIVDPEAKMVRVEAGCTWGDVDHATQPFGMAVPSGFISTTGVGGLTLGGGIGYLTRAYGLTIDNLLEVKMVLADGRYVSASEKENQDLFWAVRGGGGNFGVITSFLFKLNPVGMVYGGPMFWEVEKAPRLMRYWRDFILKAPKNINGWFGFHYVPPMAMFPKEHHMKKTCMITWCYTGDLNQAEETFKPIRQFEKPMMDFAGPIPFSALQSLFDAIYPPGLQWYWKTEFVNQLSDQAIDTISKYGSNLPSGHSATHLYPINGAAHDVGANATPWNYRSVNFSQVIVAVDPDPANNDKNIHWARDFAQAAKSYSAGGGYVNMMMDEGQSRVKAAYGDNYERLAKIKNKYDPNNLFHVNQNIQPAR